MRKRKLYFGVRRRWPDSPYAQLQQHSANLKTLKFEGDWLEKMYQQLQSQEFDAYKDQFLGGWDKIQQSGLSGGMRRGEFYAFSTPSAQVDRLQRMFDKGLQGNLMICLEDSYVQPHYVPYHDFDKLTVETPDAVIRPPNW